MVDRYIIFNGVNSKDLGIKLTGYSIATPSKKTMIVDIPFRNGSVDVSSIYSDYPLYEDREITARFYIVSRNKAKLKSDFNKILNAYVDIQGRKELQFYDQLGWIYSAEIIDSFEFDEFAYASEFEIKFIASPVKVGIDYEGSRKLWDTFNFEEDILQNTIYEVDTRQSFKLINIGRVNIPTILVLEGAVSLSNGIYATPRLQQGEHIDYNFKLEHGENTITVATDGNPAKVEIVFRKETI